MASNPNTCADVALHFSKMHGLGNDFVMVEDRQLAALALASAQLADARIEFDADWIRQFCSRLAAHLCNRNFAVGADGLIVAIDLAHLRAFKNKTAPAADEKFFLALDQFTAPYPERDSCDVAWIYVNSDGSYSAMCGNGLRCLTLFVKKLGWSVGDSFRVSTSVYPVTVSVESGTAPGGSQAAASMTVRTRLAGPKYAPEQIPLKLPTGTTAGQNFVDQAIAVGARTIKATCISMGNPHCVVFDEGQETAELSDIMGAYVSDIRAAHASGRALQKFPPALLQLADDMQKLSVFPQGVNVEFVKIDPLSPETAYVFVVERGCGPTLACASGAAAVLAAGVISKRLNKKSYVILPGGKLEVCLSSSGDQGCMANSNEYIDLTGPATKAFAGDTTLSAAVLLSLASTDSTEGVCR
ncbi:MAG: hypothetical protein JST01_17460 [Cyanobacteria bacterium SZAS TMP-1]|nr:hypothetical protein [Cyanobacteria bacterium SZAS TMP-1]